jgi:ATPase family associated with various cellular activities (AAA)
MKAQQYSLTTSLAFLRFTILGRLKLHAGKEDKIEVTGAAYYEDDSPFSLFFQTHQPSFEEYIILLLALAPHLQPDFFNQIIAEHLPEGGDLPEFGGTKGVHHRGILPTGETAQFILAGNDLEKRLEVQRMLGSEHWLAQKGILQLEMVREGEPVMSGRLILDPEVVELLTLGQTSKPRFSMDFPAERITTEMDWDDLVLPAGTLSQIREIERWTLHNDTLLHEWGMKKKIKAGYRALFYGPPGTGKTLTVALLGKKADKDVFRVDLSRVVSKYIGETEKNLSRLFDKAEHKEWILFFDEADALFGKRTGVRDAHDRYANQEVAYLLQRVEAFNGLVILASNQRANIDDAFTRRFHSIVFFPLPTPLERVILWQRTFPQQITCDSSVDWAQVASRYELSGACILNVAQWCAIEMLAEGTNILNAQRLEAGIFRELVKEGKIV